MSPEEIARLVTQDVSGLLTDAEIRKIFGSRQAFYLNPRDFRKPHVELTSGLHSNGYINCPEVFALENLRRICAQQLVRFLETDSPKLSIGFCDWVVGSDTSATALAGDVAELLGCRHGVMKKGPNKEQIWLGEMVDGEVIERLVDEGEKVLQIEELMTTAGTAERLRQGVMAAHAGRKVAFHPVILVLMHRSDVYEVMGDRVLAAHHFDIKNEDPKSEEGCTYCQNGSLLVKNPKQNWALLTGKAA